MVSQGKDPYGRNYRMGQLCCRDANTEQVIRGNGWVFVKYAPASSPLTAWERR
jgi:hypothetical protein